MNDTICAISTPIGIGGIAIVRMSGPDSLKIAKKMFKKFPKKIESHKVYYGHIVYKGEIVDEVLVNVMLAPKSYTREDVVEINCHGGYLIAKKILEILIENGARLAEPGEFTKRAFLNGRIDLMQAEAVVNVINAKNEISLKIFEKQLAGESKKEIEKLKNEFIHLSSLLEASIDFDEEVYEINLNEIKQKLMNLHSEIKRIIESYNHSKNIIEGVKIVIAGAPNAGKSSLLNYFLKKNRAIISDIPGTTRDTIEEEIFFKNFPVKFIDTDGIRESDDILEREGIKRTFEKLDEAEIIIYLYDIERGLSEYETKILKKLNDKKVILCANKIDKYPEKKVKNALPISVKEKINLDKLENKIVEYLEANTEITDENLIITNLRHAQIFKNIDKILSNLVKNFDSLYLDEISFEIREILKEIGKLTGEITTEDILDNIFSQFCIGK